MTTISKLHIEMVDFTIPYTTRYRLSRRISCHSEFGATNRHMQRDRITGETRDRLAHRVRQKSASHTFKGPLN